VRRKRRKEGVCSVMEDDGGVDWEDSDPNDNDDDVMMMMMLL